MYLCNDEFTREQLIKMEMDVSGFLQGSELVQLSRADFLQIKNHECFRCWALWEWTWDARSRTDTFADMPGYGILRILKNLFL